MSNQSPSPVNNTPLPSVWSQNNQNLDNVRKARQLVNTKHGMFASVPIICKGRACPYFQTCWIPESDLQVGERCPIEIATILERFEKYCEELNIDPEKEIVDAKDKRKAELSVAVVNKKEVKNEDSKPTTKHPRVA